MLASNKQITVSCKFHFTLNQKMNRLGDDYKQNTKRKPNIVIKMT